MAPTFGTFIWATVFIFLSLIQLTLATGSCDFTGQCVYNIQVGHCANSSKRSSRSTDCSCSDVYAIGGDSDRLSSLVRQLEKNFNALSTELTAAVSELQAKKTQLQNLKADSAKLQISVTNNAQTLNDTTTQLQQAKQNQATETASLQQAIAKTVNATRVCKAVLAASQSSTSGTSSNDAHLTFCDFENPALCGYTQDTQDNFDWTRGQGTVSSSTGPKMDHTYGSPSGHYMYIDGSKLSGGSSSGKISRIISPEIPASHAYCLRFWYNMHGIDVKTLNVYAKVGSGLGYPILTKTGDAGSDWHLAEVNLDSEYSSHPFRIVFEANTYAHTQSHWTGSHYTYDHLKAKDHIAIDDVYMYNTTCRHTPASNCPPQAHVVHNGSATTCYIVHSKPTTWYEASEECRKSDVNSHLVSITTAQEQQTLIGILTGNQTLSIIGQNGFYTSGNDEHTEHNFVWTDSGTPYPFTYSSWHPGQPNNVGGNQDCVLLQYADSDYEWGDVDCTEKHPYICEINK